MNGLVVGEKFKLGRSLGGGSIRHVFEGVNIENGEEVAVKLEPIEAENPELLNEIKMYERLKGGAGIPSLLWSGVQEDYNIMVIELLGPNLEDLFIKCGGKLSMKTVLMLADQLLVTVVFMHKQGIVHRDLKPKNMLMGIGSKAHQVYIIDFGLAQSYIDPETGEHIPPREAEDFVGTEIFASLNTHDECVQTRRDDLVTLGYVIMYLLRGSLPWQEKFFELLDSSADVTHLDLLRIKRASYWDLFESFPPEFADFLNYCLHLSYAREPNYKYLRACLLIVFYGEGQTFDFQYDWTKASAETPPPDRDISRLVEIYKILKAEESLTGQGQKREGSPLGSGSPRKRGKD